MSTARMLEQNAGSSLAWAAGNNAITTHTFDTFTRYVFRDDSILCINSDGSVAIYDEDTTAKGERDGCE